MGCFSVWGGVGVVVTSPNESKPSQTSGGGCGVASRDVGWNQGSWNHVLGAIHGSGFGMGMAKQPIGHSTTGEWGKRLYRHGWGMRMGSKRDRYNMGASVEPGENAQRPAEACGCVRVRM